VDHFRLFPNGVQHGVLPKTLGPCRAQPDRLR
jgi:hypothetical protein